jgi:hypothetical protein
MMNRMPSWRTWMPWAASVVVAGACSFDWDGYEPRPGGSAGGAAGGGGSTSSIGGAGGSGGGGGSGAAGGAGGQANPGEVICHFETPGAWMRGLAAHPDGGFVVSGDFDGTLDVGGAPLSSMGGSDGFVARFGPACEHLFSVRMGAADANDLAEAVAVLPNGDTVVLAQLSGTNGDYGAFTHSTNGQGDFVAARLDGSGNFVWTSPIGGTGDEWGRAITVDDAGDVYVAGGFSASLTIGASVHAPVSGVDVVVAKLSGDSGTPLWSYSFGGASTDRARAIAVADDGSVYIGGRRRGAIDFGTTVLGHTDIDDIYVVKLDSAGSFVWASSVVTSSLLSDEYVQGLALRPNGHVVISARFEQTVDFGGAPFSAAGSRDVFLAELDEQGEPVWFRAIGGVGEDRSGGVDLDPSGNLAVAGSFGSTADLGGGPIDNGASESIFGAVYAPDGALLWSRAFGVADLPAGVWTRTLGVAFMANNNVVMSASLVGTIDLGSGPLIDPNLVVVLTNP